MVKIRKGMIFTLMSLHHYHKGAHSEIAVWNITEPMDYFISKLTLDDHDKADIAELNDRKLLEWVSSRYLFKLLLHREDAIELRKDSFGKPYIDNLDKYISISHSGKYAAVIISDVRCGIDIQQYVEKIYRIQNRFLHQEEVDRISEDNKRDELHFLWGAKESIYKAYGKKKVDFRDHMSVSYDDEMNNSKGIIEIEDYTGRYTLSHLAHKEYMLVYAEETI